MENQGQTNQWEFVPQEPVAPIEPYPSKTFILRETERILGGIDCISIGRDDIEQMDPVTVTTVRKRIRWESPLAIITAVQNTGAANAKIYEAGIVVAVVPAGQVKQLPERGRLLLEGQATTGTTTLVVVTRMRSLCGQAPPVTPTEDEDTPSLIESLNTPPSLTLSDTIPSTEPPSMTLTPSIPSMTETESEPSETTSSETETSSMSMSETSTMSESSLPPSYSYSYPSSSSEPSSSSSSEPSSSSEESSSFSSEPSSSSSEPSSSFSSIELSSSIESMPSSSFFSSSEESSFFSSEESSFFSSEEESSLSSMEFSSLSSLESEPSE